MVPENATLLTAAVQPGSRLAKIIEGRADIMALTQAAQEAILRPRLAGGISHAERAALACRIARLSDETRLAEHYITLLAQTSADTASSQMADPSFSGAGDQRLAAILRYVDLVTQSPRQATRADIATLKNASIAEADSEYVLVLAPDKDVLRWILTAPQTVGQGQV